MTMTVSIQDNKFVPSTINVSAGTTVRWVQDGVAVHDVTGNGFSSGLLKSGETFEFTFSTPGTYQYECQIHTIGRAFMRGSVVVQ